jgi:hypothetical protein
MLDENSRFNPVTPYAVSKVLVESDVGKLASQFSPTFAKFNCVWGVTENPFRRCSKQLYRMGLTTDK